MFTLHAVTEEVRTILKWGIIFIVAIFLTIEAIKGVFFLKTQIAPTPPPPPTVLFGKIPPPQFPKNVVSKPFTFTIDTLSGTLPTFADRAKVYQIAATEPNLLSLSHASDNVNQIGFSSPGTQIDGPWYRWSDPATNSILNYNITTLNFTFTTNYLSNPPPADSNFSGTQAISQATDFFTKIVGMPDDIDTNNIVTTPYTISNNTLVSASNPSTTQVIRVDFFQKAIDDMPIVYSNPPYSTINAIVATNGFDDQIVQAQNTHKSITATFATYPLKSAVDAFNDLQNGNAYISSYFGTTNSVSLKKVYLAYYMSDTDQSYLVPVVVFEGDNGFYAYVNAIKNEWLE